jgi:hypothetical protein
MEGCKRYRLAPVPGNLNGENEMRMVLLSALFAIGVGIFGAGNASAAPAAPGLNDAANAASLIEQARVSCYNRRVCYVDNWGVRHCRLKRVCRRVYY